jgi:hypothetical protein
MALTMLISISAFKLKFSNLESVSSFMHLDSEDIIHSKVKGKGGLIF